MAKLSDIMADMAKVEDGQWVQYAAGIELRIANINNTKYRKARQEILKPRLRTMRPRQIQPDEVMELLKPAVAQYVLLDWRNIEDDKGKPIPYSVNKAIEFFGKPELRDLYDFVLEVAGEMDFFRQEQVKEEAKNSLTA